VSRVSQFFPPSVEESRSLGAGPFVVAAVARQWETSLHEIDPRVPTPVGIEADCHVDPPSWL
jgi:hypothetical protein